MPVGPHMPSPWLIAASLPPLCPLCRTTPTIRRTAGGTPATTPRCPGRPATLAVPVAMWCVPTCTAAAPWRVRGRCCAVMRLSCVGLDKTGYSRHILRIHCAPPWPHRHGTPSHQPHPAALSSPLAVSHSQGGFQGAGGLELWMKTDGGRPQVTINVGGGSVRAGCRGGAYKWGCWAVHGTMHAPYEGWALRCAMGTLSGCSTLLIHSCPVLPPHRSTTAHPSPWAS